MINLIAVDDEKDVRVLFEHFFQHEIVNGDVNLIFESSGQGCLEKLTSLEGNIIVLSDINMPEMSGIELLKIISQDFPDAKVILVSAYDQSRYQEELQQYGAVGYISKPVDFIALKSKVFEIFSV